MEVCCDIVRDLEPLYGDGLASAGSRAAIREHLSGCRECRDYYRNTAVRPRGSYSPVRESTADYAGLAKRALAHRILICCAVGAAVAVSAAAAFLAGGRK